MWIEGVIFLLIGALMLVIGWLIWKKEKITLVHDYHYARVTEQNKKAFCALMGKGTMIIGAGCVLNGVINAATGSHWGLILFGAFFAVGVGLYIRAENQYN